MPAPVRFVPIAPSRAVAPGPSQWPPARLADACVRQPLSRAVPADDAAFAARKGRLRLTVRALRRALSLRWSGQLPTLHDRIDGAWRRLLWIHEGMPQVGDALMDLAPRSLLVERGHTVDLYAARHVAGMFAADAWFGRSLSRPDDIRAEDYDAAIVLSHDRKSLALKRRQLPGLPWVSLQGHYGGPDFHRARFAAQRLADLLGHGPGADELARHAAQKLRVGAEARAAAATLLPRAQGVVAIAVGGRWPDRTYTRWHEVVAALRVRGVRRFVLVGEWASRAAAHELVDRCAPQADIVDLVGMTTLQQAQAVIGRASAAVCADGGLLHLALTTTTPVVALFNAAIDPQWRLPQPWAGTALASLTSQVDDLAPEAVAEAVAALLARADPARSATGDGFA